MLGRNGSDGLQFDDNAVKANEIGDIGLLKRLSSIFQRQALRGPERNLALREFDLQALLIDRL